MSDTLTCPKCQMENAFFDGIMFLCPDCDYKWSDNPKKIKISHHIDEYSEFDELIKLKVPFFNLEHGKLYDCKVEHEKGVEDASIIPLAFKNDKNLQFIMIDARRLFNANPNFIHEIINMDFEYIYDDGVRVDYPFDYYASITACATQKDGTLIAYRDVIYFDFKKMAII